MVIQVNFHSKNQIMKIQKEKQYFSPEDPLIKELALTLFPKSKSYLDLGCGSGANMRMFNKLGHSCTGVTLSEEEMHAAVAYGECCVLNLENGLPAHYVNKHFDLVVAAHLLEHVFYPDKLLSDIKCVVGQGLIIVIPNVLYWRNRAKLLLGIWEYQELGIMDYTHCRWYSYKTIHELMEKHGFQVIYKTATGGFFSSKTKIFKMINKWLVQMFPGLFGFQFYLVCKVNK